MRGFHAMPKPATISTTPTTKGLDAQTRRLNQHLGGPTKRGIIVNNKHNRFRRYHIALQVCTGTMNWKVAPRSAFGLAHSKSRLFVGQLNSDRLFCFMDPRLTRLS
jgi:hypothetical protein